MQKEEGIKMDETDCDVQPSSPDLFEDYPPEESYNFSNDPSTTTEKSQSRSDDDSQPNAENHWKGVPLEDLQSSLGQKIFQQVPHLIPSVNHAILVKIPILHGQVPQPFPSVSRDCWDQDHVRMPNSSESLYPIQEPDGSSRLCLRWERVQEALLRSFISSKQLEAAIFSYNSRYSERWDFVGLHTFLNNTLQEEEAEHFFDSILPKMVTLALQLPLLVTGPLPLLKKHKAHTVSLGQLQIASLLANAFFCTFPRRNTTKRGSEYASYPDINFNRLFHSGGGDPSSNVMEKLKCLVNYFRRVTEEQPQGVVTFSRKYLPQSSLPDWCQSNKEMPKLHITSNGRIEDEGFGMMQVDFANKYVGGGVLGSGCVQEEIRFVICPELIISRLFTECLDSNEALLIVGCERFNNYSGYGSSFTWDGDCLDKTPTDSDSRKQCTVIAIDALYFGNPRSQYTLKNIVRELNKAFVGFSDKESSGNTPLPAVATGNWGCGAFRGDAHLKALLQFMAAAEAGRSVVYFTFGDSKLRERIYKMHHFLCEHKITVGRLCKLLFHFTQNVPARGNVPDLYGYLYNSILGKYDREENFSLNKSIRSFFEKAKTDSKTESVEQKQDESLLSETGLTMDDLETAAAEIEDDSPFEDEEDPVAEDSNSSRAKKKKEIPGNSAKQFERRSCLDMLEESLILEESERNPKYASRIGSLRIQTKSHSETSSSRSDPIANDSLMDTTPSKPEENSRPKDQMECLPSPMDTSDGSPMSSVNNVRSTPNSHSKNVASKRKISDYFSVVKQ